LKDPAGSGSVHIMTDPEVPNTCVSNGSGSTTLLKL
jgi:hypothetical protein